MSSKKSRKTNLLTNPSYKPNNLIDYLIEENGLKSDVNLVRRIDMTAPYISKVRHMKLPISNGFLVRAHLAFGVPIRDMICMAGMESEYGK